MLLFGSMIAFLLCGAATLTAEDCVEFDIEAPPVVVPGETAEFSVELTNCGDEARLIEVALEITVDGEPAPIPIPEIRLGVIGAGETFARTMTLPIPQFIPTGLYEICVTVTLGTASATDCVTIEITKSLLRQAPNDGDCLELDFEATPQVVQGETATFSAELVNCGDEPAIVILTVTATISGEPAPLPPVQLAGRLAAGESVSKSIELPVPPVVPTGLYEICLTAESGSASVTDCAEIEVLPAGGSSPQGSETGSRHKLLGQNAPNPFNPTTQIPFTLAKAGHVRLTVHDVTGRTVNTLVEGHRSAGSQAAFWNGTDSKGNPVASGVYFYRIEFEGIVEARKMTLLK
jgi:hypothetical protein